ncbi:DUF4267 domain-containing protein [Hymenobacter sp. GOD-10R]|uniref:DUF4267 domain-containing protein n=1 Tax=Hymenobacter sp. GOD-10R TaxID=3093922 RepID=UPI002D7A2C1F|nr:DUF4267 domain-containing protein [Hymenobacter sp. GOD-10R]WRQ30414.1 DUF4267 domain-containing protein [Hymenobacter sp. GOD-10R]
MTQRNITRSLSLLLGLGMIFIGARFLLAPRAGAEGFGVFLPADSNYAFHYAKGIRDVFSGLLLALFAGLGYDRPLAWVTLLGALIPCVDLAIVLAQPTGSLALATPHLLAIVLLLALTVSLFTLTRPASTNTK